MTLCGKCQVAYTPTLRFQLRRKLCLDCSRQTFREERRKQNTAAPRTIWAGMKARCYNQSSRNYKHYGARGITVCDRWRDSFENFLADMGERPEGASIDRIDNDGNYEPSNCKWATRTEQNRNRSNTRYATHNGEILPLAEIERRTGTKYSTLYMRAWRKHGSPKG